MNRFDKMAVGAAIVATLICRSDTMNAYYWHLEILHSSAMTWTIAVAGWIIATYGPIAIAAWFWRLAKRVRAPWVLHVLFLVCAVITLSTGVSLMLLAGGDTSSDHQTGEAVMTPALLFVVAVGAYFAALIWRQISAAIKRRAANHQ
ncbi:MAG TPA: hypothetical protein VIT45_07870 [Allosphingosinicella sp.]